MKKLLLIAIALCLLVSCASILPNSGGSKFMATIEDNGTDSGDWKKDYYVDEFKSPTDESYIYVPINGIFSNSATTGSSVKGKLMVEKDLVVIKLLEYGTYPITVTKGGIWVKMKAGEEVVNMGLATLSGSRILLFDTKTVFDVFNRYDKVQFYIEITDYVTSRYNFTINTKGFTHAYKTAFPIIE